MCIVRELGEILCVFPYLFAPLSLYVCVCVCKCGLNKKFRTLQK